MNKIPVLDWYLILTHRASPGGIDMLKIVDF